MGTSYHHFSSWSGALFIIHGFSNLDSIIYFKFYSLLWNSSLDPIHGFVKARHSQQNSGMFSISKSSYNVVTAFV